MLKVPPEELTLADIFLTVNSEMLTEFDSSDCGEVGIELDNVLDEITQSVEQQLVTALSQHTLADLVKRFK